MQVCFAEKPSELRVACLWGSLAAAILTISNPLKILDHLLSTEGGVAGFCSPAFTVFKTLHKNNQ